MQTTVTMKGTISIPVELRQRHGMTPGTKIEWSDDGDGIRAVPSKKKLTAQQKHILARSGTWDGRISGKDLLKLTRP